MKIFGEIQLPGDKSLSHRAIMLASISKGECNLYNLPNSRDILSTINCLRLCGVKIENNKVYTKVLGGSLKKPETKLDCNNSGTSARLLVGLLAGQNISAYFYGDESLSKRPMNRVIEPLKKMGVNIKSNNNRLPFEIINIALEAISYKIPVESAQVKSCIIFASLGCSGVTKIRGRINTRDHLERMISQLSSEGIKYHENMIEIHSEKIKLKPFSINLSGDISSASFFIGLACLIRGSHLVINNLLINKHRLGFVETLKSMGANIVIDRVETEFNEEVGRMTVIGDRDLSACKISKDKIPSMIDEIPLLSLVCAHVNGVSKIEGLKELQYKESNRYNGILCILREMGVNIKEAQDDSIIIKGKNKLYNTNNLDCFNDHRLAMMISLAQILSKNNISYDECINVSFPDFRSIIQKVLI